jgi:hypothetical protein
MSCLAGGKARIRDIEDSVGFWILFLGFLVIFYSCVYWVFGVKGVWLVEEGGVGNVRFGNVCAGKACNVARGPVIHPKKITRAWHRDHLSSVKKATEGKVGLEYLFPRKTNVEKRTRSQELFVLS